MNPMSHPEFDAHEQVVFCSDQAYGLRAVIAIHSTHLGPAAGGVRMWPYADSDAALTDALRLSTAMSHKNALAGLPLGGGKSVIIADPAKDKTSELLGAFAGHVQRLGGAYWCAEDVGMGIADIEVLAESCDFVFGLPGQIGDPAPHTAYGVFQGMRAAIDHRLGGWPDELRVAVQGVGNVGFDLCELLHKAGASLVVSDVSADATAAARDAFGAEVVGLDQIYDAPVQVFAPCALGGVLNDDTVGRLRASVIAGSANNQLAEPRHGRMLHERGIAYAPDFLVNAGGMLSIGGAIFGETDPEAVTPRLDGLYEATLDLLSEANERNAAPSDVALSLARRRMDRS